eukprot:gene10971-11126_t
MFLPLELTWVLPMTSFAWSQLQLVPNIVYRIDSMLQAASLHQQLGELMHGGGRATAADKIDYADELPVPEDEEAAAAGACPGLGCAAAAGGGGGGGDGVAEWVWGNVAPRGMLAAAAVCEALQVLPQGAADIVRGSLLTHLRPAQPPPTAEPSSFHLAAGNVSSPAAVERVVNRMTNLTGGPFPYVFRDPAWLVEV